MRATTWIPVLKALQDGDRHSGEALAQQLGLTRSAIWQRVSHLRSLGLPIDAGESGYQIPGGAYIPDPRWLSQHTQERVQLVSEVDSTNQQLLESGDGPECLLALSQRSGRGRRGRPWIGAPGRTLMLSIGAAVALPLQQLSGLSVALGIAVCRYLRSLGIPTSLKWPNDLWVGDQKLAGFLTELKGDVFDRVYVVMGLGLNLYKMDAFEEPHAAVASHLGRPWQDEDTAGLIRVIFEGLRTYPGALNAQWQAYYGEVDALKGREIEVTGVHLVLQGVSGGIDEHGQLCVLNSEGAHTVSAGDVSVRPRS